MNATINQILVQSHQQDLRAAASAERQATGGRQMRTRSTSFATTVRPVARAVRFFASLVGRNPAAAH